MGRKSYTNSFKYKMIEEYSNGKPSTHIEMEYGVTSSTFMKWFKTFIKDGRLGKDELTKEEIVKLEQLREKATIANLNKLRGGLAYDNFFKYKIIEEICNGKSYEEVCLEYSLGPKTHIRWFKNFIANGVFDENELSIKEKLKLEQLREKATRRELDLRLHGGSTSESFEWILDYDRDLKEWKEYAEGWIKTIIRNKGNALNMLSNFFKKYIIQHNITRSVQEFITKTYDTPDFYEIIYSERGSKPSALNKAKQNIRFIDWIIEEKFSVEDDLGNKLTPAEFSNPLIKYLPDSVKSSQRNESDKNILPYRYIKDLRNILCPPNAICFKDLKFAQDIGNTANGGGEWFIVDKSIIDENDPDCVFRVRRTTMFSTSYY